MMYIRKQHLKVWSALLMPLILTGCIDDNYDLSDIDTTTQLKVNDLTVPVNLKEILLEKMIDLNDSDPDALIKVRDYNGQSYYYLNKKGTFDATPKTIDPIRAPKPDYQEMTTTRILVNPLAAGSRRKAEAAYKEYNVTLHDNEYTYRVGKDGNPAVDGAIVSVSEIGMASDGLLHVGLSITSDEVGAKADHVELYDLEIIMPEGVHANYKTAEYNINSSKGRLTIPHIVTTNGTLKIDLTVSAIDFATATNPEGIKVTDGSFDYTGTIGISSGRLLIYPNNGYSLASLPDEIDFTTRYELTSFIVDSFSGVFDYEVNFDDINSLDLSGLPDFLNNPETNFAIANPSLTLEVNSPVAPYGLSCSTGLTLTAHRNEGASHSESVDVFTIGDKAVDQIHVLAPTKEAMNYISLPAGKDVDFTTFAGLGDILAGEGIPQRIDVSFKSAKCAAPHVFGTARKFPLGKKLDQIHGSYTFSAPLAPTADSRIVYNYTDTGWNDEDVDAIEISTLKVTALASSDIPAGARVSFRPIDTEGKRIPLTNPQAATITLPAMAKNEPVSVELTGTITHLDGIYIEAVVDDFDGQPLSPDQTIKFSEIRATVTGTYTKKL